MLWSIKIPRTVPGVPAVSLAWRETSGQISADRARVNERGAFKGIIPIDLEKVL
jgi:hypothetical protein